MVARARERKQSGTRRRDASMSSEKDTRRLKISRGRMAAGVGSMTCHSRREGRARRWRLFAGEPRLIAGALGEEDG